MSLFANKILHNYIIAIGATTFIVHEPELEHIPYLKMLINYDNVNSNNPIDLYKSIQSLAKDKPFIENSINESLVANCFDNILKCLFDIEPIKISNNSSYYIDEDDLVVGEFNNDHIIPIKDLTVPQGIRGVSGPAFAGDIQKEDKYEVHFNSNNKEVLTIKLNAESNIDIINRINVEHNIFHFMVDLLLIKRETLYTLNGANFISSGLIFNDIKIDIRGNLVLLLKSYDNQTLETLKRIGLYSVFGMSEYYSRKFDYHSNLGIGHAYFYNSMIKNYLIILVKKNDDKEHFIVHDRLFHPNTGYIFREDDIDNKISKVMIVKETRVVTSNNINFIIDILNKPKILYKIDEIFVSFEWYLCFRELGFNSICKIVVNINRYAYNSFSQMCKRLPSIEFNREQLYRETLSEVKRTPETMELLTYSYIKNMKIIEHYEVDRFLSELKFSDSDPYLYLLLDSYIKLIVALDER